MEFSENDNRELSEMLKDTDIAERVARVAQAQDELERATQELETCEASPASRWRDVIAAVVEQQYANEPETRDALLNSTWGLQFGGIRERG